MLILIKTLKLLLLLRVGCTLHNDLCSLCVKQTANIFIIISIYLHISLSTDIFYNYLYFKWNYKLNTWMFYEYLSCSVCCDLDTWNTAAEQLSSSCKESVFGTAVEGVRKQKIFLTRTCLCRRNKYMLLFKLHWLCNWVFSAYNSWKYIRLKKVCQNCAFLSLVCICRPRPVCRPAAFMIISMNAKRLNPI